MKQTLTITTASERQSIAFGKKVAKVLSVGMVVALHGTLGSGKTTLTKGLVAGLFGEHAVAVKSPSFALVNQYDGPFPVYHIDCYRLGEESDFDDLGIDDYLFSEGVTIVEWPERIENYLPAERVDIAIDYVSEKERSFTVRSSVKNVMNRLQEIVHV